MSDWLPPSLRGPDYDGPSLEKSLAETGANYTVTADGRYLMIDPVTGEKVSAESANLAHKLALAMTGELQNPLAMPGMDTIINWYGDREGNNASPFGGGTALSYWYDNPETGLPGPLTVTPEYPNGGPQPGAQPGGWIGRENPISGVPNLQPPDTGLQFNQPTPYQPVNRSWSNSGPTGTQTWPTQPQPGQVSDSTKQALAQALTSAWSR